MSFIVGAVGWVTRVALRFGVVWVRRFCYYLLVVVVFVGGIIGWEVVVMVLGFQGFVFLCLLVIVAALIENLNSLWFGLLLLVWVTLIEVFGGLVIGMVTGVIVVFATARWATVWGLLFFVVVAANVVLIIAFAPILNNWFGLENLLVKMMMVAVFVFFSVMVNVTWGFIQVDSVVFELMCLIVASEWQILWKVWILNVLLYFFMAMKLAIMLSLIGAIVGEYFGGASLVFGWIIVQSSSVLRFDIMWVVIFLAAVIGIVFYFVVVVLERIVIPWHALMRVIEVV